MPFVIAFAVLLIAAFLQLIASVFLLALAYGRDYGRGEGDCRQLYIFLTFFWCVETQEYLCFFAFCPSCLSRCCPVLFACKNTERISVKFDGGDHYREQIK